MNTFSYLERDSPTKFRPPFFSSFEPAWATDQQITTFSILVKISPSYWNFSESPQGIIPRRVICRFWILIKGTVQRNFQPVFFIIRSCLDHWEMSKNIFDFGYDFAKLFNFFVKISPGYHTPASHSYTWPRGVNCQFLNCLHRPLKGQCHKNKCGITLYY